MFKKKGFGAARSLALLGLVFLVSSCNRGTGCPNNFRVDIQWDSILQTIASLF
ncbi:MAG: hypothetical protein K9I85_00975 [Saprospiraceae bacterium]|nr:hypothetical protein [Saprospiraceae bacterium]